MTIEERLSLLEQQIAAQVPTPTEYYTSRWSGEEIDNRIASLSNRNLLDNWYFVGGGSQQGGGQFPINQRGQTSYDTGTISGYGIDGWWSFFCNFDVTTGQLSQSISQTYGGAMRNPLENPSALAGKTVTCSILAAQVSGAPTMNLTKSTGINSGMVSIQSATLVNGLNTFTVTVPDDVGGSTYPMLFLGLSVPVDSSVRLIAAKLELGPTQTLAYQDESGAWQLFETPDYGEELAKCQRYYLPIDGIGRFPAVFSSPSTILQVFIPTPVTMRSIPTVLGITSLSARVYTGATNSQTLSVSEVLKTETGVQIIFSCSWPGSTSPAAYSNAVVVFGQRGALSAEL